MEGFSLTDRHEIRKAGDRTALWYFSCYTYFFLELTFSKVLPHCDSVNYCNCVPELPVRKCGDGSHIKASSTVVQCHASSRRQVAVCPLYRVY